MRIYHRCKGRTQQTELLNKDKLAYLIVKLIPVCYLILLCIVMFNFYLFQDDSMWAKAAVGTKFDQKMERGDVILFEHDGQAQIRRIIGVPGDHIEINYDRIYINGQLAKEPYLSAATHSISRIFDVPDGEVFVLADNRECGLDSRDYGFISIENIIEKIIFLL